MTYDDVKQEQVSSAIRHLIVASGILSNFDLNDHRRVIDDVIDKIDKEVFPENRRERVEWELSPSSLIHQMVSEHRRGAR